jgi:DNA-binding LytR/AlgR family response regulator
MIKTAILDDNLEEVEELKKWLIDHPSVDFAGVFDSAIGVQKIINQVELLFCDIEMPGINGFDFIRGLKRKPQIVFVSSHGEYAIDSFEFEPIHFIQKPADQARVLEAIERAKNLKINRASRNEFMFVKESANNFVKVNFKDILFISAMDDFVQIHLEKSRITSYMRLKEIKKRLPSLFVQTHRSFIVNLHYVFSLNTKDLELKNGMEIPVSSGYKMEIKAFL